MDVEINGKRANARLLVEAKTTKELQRRIKLALDFLATVRGVPRSETSIITYGDGVAIYFVKALGSRKEG